LLIEYGPWLVPRRFWNPATEAVLTTCPSSPCLDGGHEMPDAVDNSPDVDTDDELPVAGRHVGQPSAVHRYAGVVARDVQLAEIALGLSQGI
jgi:hypothetical protein